MFRCRTFRAAESAQRAAIALQMSGDANERGSASVERLFVFAHRRKQDPVLHQLERRPRTGIGWDSDRARTPTLRPGRAALKWTSRIDASGELIWNALNEVRRGKTGGSPGAPVTNPAWRGDDGEPLATLLGGGVI